MSRERTRASRRGEIAERAGTAFEVALDRIRPAAAAVLDRMTSLLVRPAEVQVEFGIKLTAKAGAIVASTDAEANFRVMLTWRDRNGGG